MRISRRNFLVKSSALVGSSVSATRVLGHDRSILERWTTPEDWYSSDDAGDWVHAFERAQRHASLIKLGPKVYEISRGIINASHKTWLGEGSKTVLRNSRNPETPDVLHCGFMMGNMHPACFGARKPADHRLSMFNILDADEGSSILVLENQRDAAAFTVGKTVFIRTKAEVQEGEYFFPSDGQFNTIAYMRGVELGLTYPCTNTLRDAVVCPIENALDQFLSGVFDRPVRWFMVDDVHLRNISIDADYITSTRTGMFGCSIKNVEIINGKAALAINAAVRCKISQIRANNCSDRLLEIKCYSDNSVFSNIAGSVAESHRPHNTIIDVGERSSKVTISGISATNSTHFAQSAPFFTTEGRDNVIENFRLSLERAPENYTPMYVFASSVGRATGATIRNGIFNGSAECARHLQIGGGDGFQPCNFIVDNVKFTGSTRMKQSIWVAGSGRGGSISNCTFPYQVQATRAKAFHAVKSNNSIAG